MDRYPLNHRSKHPFILSAITVKCLHMAGPRLPNRNTTIRKTGSGKASSCIEGRDQSCKQLLIVLWGSAFLTEDQKSAMSRQ